METRINRLNQEQDQYSREAIRAELEKWDADQGRAMKQAEAFLLQPRRLYNWSPKLRKTGILRRYWKLRMRETTKGEDHSVTFQRLQSQLQVYDPTFCLPSLGQDLPLDKLRTELNQSTKALRQTQSESVDLRFQFYEDLLAIYKNDTNPTTQAVSMTKAKIVENTIRAEQCRPHVSEHKKCHIAPV
jgi:sugar diacid utilization regulator